MEAVVPISTDKVRIIVAANKHAFSLRRHAFAVEYWMMINVLLDDFIWINKLRLIQGDTKGGIAFNALQNIHIVRHCRRLR